MIKSMFRFPKNVSYNDEALTYSTPFRMASKLCDFIDALYKMNNKSNRVPNLIIDMTACIGGNTLEFARRYKKVESFEINKEFYEMLTKNIVSYKLTNIKAKESNSIDWLTGLKRAPLFSGIFFDPPWGGGDYKKEDKIPDLLMKDSNDKSYGVIDITKMALKKKFSIIVIKLPYNFNLDTFRLNKLKIYTMHYNKCVFVILFPQYCV